MTCILGLEHNGKVYMGADSSAVSGYDGFKSRLKKVFRRGPFLIGYTTSFRMGQLLQYDLNLSGLLIEPTDDLEFMSTAFITAVRDCLKAGGYAKIDNGTEECGQFLVGFRGRLYSIGADFQVNSSHDGYMAIGAGFAYALGALEILLNWQHDQPERNVISALQASGHFSVGVSQPYYVEVLA